MPALSPTMTEGNITNWKLKEGDAYSAGDVILEIETDKATMDVEAQDDGVLAKILIADGKKGVSVGTSIAVMAEQDDDLSKLEMTSVESTSTKQESPAESSESTESELEKNAEAAANTEPKKLEKSQASKTHDTTKMTNKDGSSLSPAVQFLLTRFGIMNANAVPATGPKGRLVKGDILAFAKEIDGASSKTVADAYALRGKLDLSNIKKAPPAQEPVQKPKVDEPKVEKNPIVEIRQQVDLNRLILLSEQIREDSGVEISVQELAAKAAAKAFQDIPTFGLPESSRDDQLFEEIIGGSGLRQTTVPTPLSLQKSSGMMVNAAEHFGGGAITLPSTAPNTTLLAFQAASPAVPAISDAQSGEYDILDFLADKPRTPTVQSASFGANHSPSVMIASLSFKHGSIDAKTATIYLDRVSQYVESPAHLFL